MTTIMDLGTATVRDLTVLIQHINGGDLGAVGYGLLLRYRALTRWSPHCVRVEIPPFQVECGLRRSLFSEIYPSSIV